ncbi:MAG: hypothetical protein EZS28_052807, partial [Streblomastix strix]
DAIGHRVTPNSEAGDQQEDASAYRKGLRGYDGRACERDGLMGDEHPRRTEVGGMQTQNLVPITTTHHIGNGTRRNTRLEAQTDRQNFAEQASTDDKQLQNRKAERTLFARAWNENGTNANYFNLAANSINSHLDSEAGSHMLGAQIIARSDTANNDAIGITNLLFEIQQLGKIRLKTKRFCQLTPSAIWKQVMRPMLNQNENQVIEQNQEIQIMRIFNDMPSLNSGPRWQPPPGQGPYA